MNAITIRPQRVTDAKRFLEILSHPDFIHFPAPPATLAAERRFLSANATKRRQGVEFNFTVLFKRHVVGAVGIKVDQHRKHIGEIGYFIDRDHWGKGFATKAVRLAEQFAFKQLHLKRIEIITHLGNKASQRVAEKCRYRKEGIQRGKIPHAGKYLDACSLAKTASA